MLWNIAVNDAGAEYDPLTLLRSRTMFGRPDWMSIYGRMKQAIENGQYVAGSNSQLKTKVGVGLLYYRRNPFIQIPGRHTSAVLEHWHPPLNRRLFVRAMQMSNSPFTRSV
jgi:hypothetical protein